MRNIWSQTASGCVHGSHGSDRHVLLHLWSLHNWRGVHHMMDKAEFNWHAVQGTWAGDEWQSCASILDFLLNSGDSETIKTLGGYAAPVLNDLISTGDIFLAGIAARIVHGITKHEPSVLIQSGFDVSGLVKVLLEDDTPELIKQLVVFTLARVSSSSHIDVAGHAGLDGNAALTFVESARRRMRKVREGGG